MRRSFTIREALAMVGIGFLGAALVACWHQNVESPAPSPVIDSHAIASMDIIRRLERMEYRISRIETVVVGGVR